MTDTEFNLYNPQPVLIVISGPSGVGKDTVTRYVRMGGAHAEKLHDELVAFSPDDPGDAAR